MVHYWMKRQVMQFWETLQMQLFGLANEVAKYDIPLKAGILY